MRIEETAIPGVLIVTPEKKADHRGFFSETFRASALEAVGVRHGWEQDNHSLSSKASVVRGLHFQAPPAAQAKPVRVLRGAILDVAVDIRLGSPTYGRHLAFELSADDWRQIYVPAGLAHGFCTLTENTEVLYKVSTGFSPELEGGLAWNDPMLQIAWPCREDEAVLSERDRLWPPFAGFDSPFIFEA
jgi:dTDP-4-dehydrorhamnose 3,5-epimerase